jgi:hypothetical protein
MCPITGTCVYMHTVELVHTYRHIKVTRLASFRYIQIGVHTSAPQLPFHRGNPKIIFHILKEPCRRKPLQARKIWQRGAFLSPSVRRLCDNSKRTQTWCRWINLNMNRPKRNKEAVDLTRRLLQYSELRDKNSRDISRDISFFRCI